MSSHADILFANDAFYIAFSTRDMEAMDAVWANQTSITCIHPGWSLLCGRDAVLGSWRTILENPLAPKINCMNAEAYRMNEVAYVTCVEQIEMSYLAATNIFVRQSNLWRMVHHQASPAPAPTSTGGAHPPISIQ
jgi:hypothetical protein